MIRDAFSSWMIMVRFWLLHLPMSDARRQRLLVENRERAAKKAERWAQWADRQMTSHPAANREFKEGAAEMQGDAESVAVPPSCCGGFTVAYGHEIKGVWRQTGWACPRCERWTRTRNDGDEDTCPKCGHPEPDHYAWSTECADPTILGDLVSSEPVDWPEP